MSTISDDQPSPSTPAADPAPRPSRRVFSPEYKLAIVAEYENAPNGEKGAILRREGLYSSHIIESHNADRRRDSRAPSPSNEETGRRFTDERFIEEVFDHEPPEAAPGNEIGRNGEPPSNPGRFTFRHPAVPGQKRRGAKTAKAFGIPTILTTVLEEAAVLAPELGPGLAYGLGLIQIPLPCGGYAWATPATCLASRKSPPGTAQVKNYADHPATVS